MAFYGHLYVNHRKVSEIILKLGLFLLLYCYNRTN